MAATGAAAAAATLPKLKRSYFIVDDDKADYSATLELGNVLYRASEPRRVLLRLSKATTPLPLDPEPSTKKRENHKVSSDAFESSQTGLFAKILGFFGLGFGFSLGASRSDANLRGTSYDIAEIRYTSFAPSGDFLAGLGQQQRVKDVLQRSPDRHAFLVTGLAEATGVKFESVQKVESGSGGNVSAGGAAGVKRKKSRKNVLKVQYEIKEPTLLAYSVSKLMLKDGVIEAEEYVDGAFLGQTDGEEGPVQMQIEADLSERDVDWLEHEIAYNELTGEGGTLYFPKG